MASENPVLFGIKDAQVESTPTQYDNILSGSPLWIKNPSKESQLCDVCGKPMVFLMQSESELSVLQDLEF